VENGRPVDLAVTQAALTDLVERSEAVALAAEQAAADCSTYIERVLARWHESARAGVDPATNGDADADEATALRDRLNELAGERRRLAAILREHGQAVSYHVRAAREETELAAQCGESAADTRRELYGLIADLAALTDEARAAATAPEPAATNGVAAGTDFRRTD
jgi:hypothetical protein